MNLGTFLNQLRLLTQGSSFKPHKYLLLLAIIDLINNKHQENKFYFDDNLKSYFTKYFEKYKREGDSNRPHTPFFHLKSSGFWHLKAKPGREDSLRELSTVGGPRAIVDNIDYAYLSENVYELFANKDTSAKIKEHIISILESQLNRDKVLSISEESEQYVATNIKESLFHHEEKAINAINSEISSIGRILNNVYLYDNQTQNYYEYDIILVTHTGIYVVELKHWSGHIRVSPYNWLINGTHFRNDPHKNNSFKCKILKGIYQHHFRTYPDVWVESVVVLTNPEAVVEGANAPGPAAEQDIHNLTFASISDFVTYLKKRERSASERLLDDKQINAIVNYLNSLNNPRHSVKYSVPGYETLEYISQKPECIELIARPVDGRAKGLNRFRVFRTPLQAAPEEKERFIKKAYNTLNAVSQIGDHPHIHKVWVIKNEDGDIIEGSDWSETGTLRDLIRQQKGAFPLDKALKICRGITLALKTAHQIDVIHRAVKPENILMMNDIPKLMNFDLAYQIEEDRVTVMPDVSVLKDDGYLAPEILAGKDIDEGTDFFSLGVIVYEMLTGAKPFASVRKFMAEGGVLSEESVQRLAKKGVPEKVIEAIKGMVYADRVGRLKDSEKIIAALSTGAEERPPGDDSVSININVKLQPGEQYDVYEIIELIGEGAEAQIYKASTVRSEEVVLKLFNKEIPRERIFQEFEITSAVQSAYVVHCDKIGYWKNDRYFIVLNYIEGESMREMIERKQRPDPGTFLTVALCLMEAVEAFHEHKDSDGNPKPLLHSDIKPDNVLITKDRKAVLIDCGLAGEPRVDLFQGTTGYVLPDSIRGTDMKFSQDGDLFALGVTLWEWLCGTKPYNNPAIGDSPQIPFNLGEDMQEYMPWLMNAVATEEGKRFASVKEMREFFLKRKEKREEATASEQECAAGAESAQKLETYPLSNTAGGEQAVEDTEQLPAVSGNLFVTYLNSLSNASAFNENATAESQLDNPFFKRILVNNPLAGYIYEELARKNHNVILTGNAGDGKTTIAAGIFKKATGVTKSLQPREDIEVKNLVIIKDMSELPENDRINVLKEAMKSPKNNYLVVSNTGTLLESFRKLKVGNRETNESELLNALKADKPQFVLNKRFLIVNIGRMDSIKTAGDVFKRMLKLENWTPCGNCKYREDCPIYRNVKLLQENLDVVCERVILLYKRLYEYNYRLTMRQMTGHLAYAITAGRNCSQIASMSLTALRNYLCGSLFFNRFFGDDGDEVVVEAAQLVPVQRVREVEFGVVLDPSFERKAWMKEGKSLPIAGGALSIFKKLQAELDNNGPAARRQVRRLVYFFGSLDDEDGKHYISVFLRSPMLLEFLEFTKNVDRLPPLWERNYRLRILQVLQEYFIGMRLPEDGSQIKDLFITLNRRSNYSETQMVLADFRAEDFELTVKPRYKVGEDASGMFCLRFKQGEVGMDLDLPFLDYVARRYEGEVAEKLSAYYADRLERFKVALLNVYMNRQKDEQALLMLRIGADRKFAVMKGLISGGSLEVLV